MTTGVERVAVTGLGAVTALGADAESSFARLVEGYSGIGTVRGFDVGGQRSQLAAEVESAVNGEPDEASSRTAYWALRAAREALTQAGALNLDLGLVVGTTTGGMRESESFLGQGAERFDVDGCLRSLHAEGIASVAEQLAACWPRVTSQVTLCSACSSSANAIVLGAAWILARRCSRVLVGGADALALLTLSGFNSLGATSPTPCRPFDREPSGMNLGEAAAFLVLEQESAALARQAPVLAWLSGWSLGSEAHHLTHPEPSGDTAVRLMNEALARAGLGPSDIDYLNAHGTGTQANDAMEARAIRRVLGEHSPRVWVSSCKGQLGHTLGAAGAVEACMTVQALRRGWVPPTGGLVAPDPQQALCHVMAKGVQAELRAALSNSFGFGGQDTVLVFQAAGTSRPKPPAIEGGVNRAVNRRVVVTGVGLLNRRGFVTEPQAVVESIEAAEPETGVSEPPAWRKGLLLEKSSYFNEISELAAVGVAAVLNQARLPASGTGLVVGNAHGSLMRTLRHLERLFTKGARRINPKEFPQLLPSAPSANVSLYAGLTGPCLNVSGDQHSADAAWLTGLSLLEAGALEAVVVGAVEPREAGLQTIRGSLLDEGSAFLALEERMSAQRRGASILAEVEWCWTGSEPRQLSRARPGAPPPQGRALVLLPDAASDAVLEGLTRLGWAQVPRQTLGTVGGNHLARSAMALAIGVAQVATGAVDRLLMVSAASRRVHLSLLVRARWS